MTKQNWSAYPQLKMQTKLLSCMKEKSQSEVLMMNLLPKRELIMS